MSSSIDYEEVNKFTKIIERSVVAARQEVYKELADIYLFNKYGQPMPETRRDLSAEEAACNAALEKLRVLHPELAQLYVDNFINIT